MEPNVIFPNISLEYLEDIVLTSCCALWSRQHTASTGTRAPELYSLTSARPSTKSDTYLTLTIRSFLHEGTMKLKLGNVSSTSWKVTAGMPRGSLQSPLLFLLFTAHSCLADAPPSQKLAAHHCEH